MLGDMRRDSPQFRGVVPLLSLRVQGLAFSFCVLIGFVIVFFLSGWIVSLLSLIGGYIIFVLFALILRLFAEHLTEAQAKITDSFLFLICIVGIGVFVSWAWNLSS